MGLFWKILKGPPCHDIIREMFQSGELQSLLKHKGVATKAPAPA